jgi:environmental stress-induced protein Ves
VITRFSTLPVSPWRNGAGRKADVASTVDWHVGFAWLDADAPFSDFTGHDRTITLIDGPGFTLRFTDHPALRVDTLYRPTSFDGGWETECHLLGEPCMVLNAMTARTGYRHSVTIVDVGNTPTVDPAATATFLVLLTGTAILPDGTAMQPRDTLRINEAAGLNGSPGSRIAVINIDRVPGCGV